MANNCNNWLFTQEELQSSPSRKDGISWENEKGLRHNACIFILEIGKHLRRGKTDKTAYIRDSGACILFHRFFTAQSFKSHNRFIVGAACLFLAGKIEGCFRHLSEIVGIYWKVRAMGRDKDSPTEAEIKEMVLVAERVILHTLNFDMHIEHHFKPLASKLQTDLKMYISEDTRVAVMNSAFCFIRDSFGTVLCLLYPAHLRAAGALFLAILQLGIKPQLQPQRSLQQQQRRVNINGANGLGMSWYELFKNDIKENDLKSICSQIIDVYESKSWIPKSEAKAPPDINNLKSHLSTFFGKDTSISPQSLVTTSGVNVDGNMISNGNSNSQINRKSDQITQPPQNVKKIETLVEKNRKINSPSDDNMNIKNNNDVVAPRLSPPLPRAVAVPLTGGSNNDNKTLAPPLTPGYLPPPPLPTPDYLPPPPSNSSLATAVSTSVSARPAVVAIPPPTPDYVPPPPMPPSNVSTSVSNASCSGDAQPLPIALPTPEYVPPPPVPPQQTLHQHHFQHYPDSHMNLNCFEGVGIGGEKAPSAPAPLDKTSKGSLISSKRGVVGNGYGHNSSTAHSINLSTGLSKGYSSTGSVSNGSYNSSVGSPPSYCSPPDLRMEAEDEESTSPKRPRLQYNCIQ